MTSRSAQRKPITKNIVKKSAPKSAAKSRPVKLPEWNLADLYSGIDAPEIARDLEKMDADCVAFETDYKGKLAENAAGEDGGRWLAGRAGQRNATTTAATINPNDARYFNWKPSPSQTAANTMKTTSVIASCMIFSWYAESAL